MAGRWQPYRAPYGEAHHRDEPPGVTCPPLAPTERNDMQYTQEQIEEHRRQWVEALRSGKYQQTTGMLARQEGDGFAYCCLGVACELAGVVYEVKDVGYEVRKAYGEDGEALTLPREVQEWLGVTSDSPDLASYVEVGDEGFENVLASLNDDYSFSFSDIADAIERHGLA